MTPSVESRRPTQPDLSELRPTYSDGGLLGTFTEYEYDPLSFRLTRLRTLRPSGGGGGGSGGCGGGSTVVLQDLFYFYDPVGNITTIRDDAHEDVFFAGQQVSPTQDFVYDAVYRLVSASGREHAGGVGDAQRDQNDLPLWNLPHPNDAQALRRYTEDYEYDAVGNIQRVTHTAAGSAVGSWTRHYRYGDGPFTGGSPPDPPVPANNRLHSTSMPGDAVGGPYTAIYPHDANGNMVAMPHLAEIAHTHADQMKRADLGGGTAYYTYDASGERVRKVIQRLGTTREERIYLGGWELYRKRQGAAGDVVLERETLHVMDDTRRIAMVETKTVDADVAGTLAVVPRTRYQYSNHLDSAHLECDETGLVISYEEYHPYGTPAYRSARSGVEVSDRRYRYTGKERDEETGFQYHSARYYAPWLGRWTTSDAAGMLDGLSLYAYTRGNPVCLRDPSGHFGEALLAKARALQQAVAQAAEVVTTAAEVVAGVAVESLSRHPFAVAGKGVVDLVKGAKASLETGDLRPLVAATPAGKVVTTAMKLADVARTEGARGLVQKLIPLNDVKPELAKAKQAWESGDAYSAARHATKAVQAVGDTILMAYGGAKSLPKLAEGGAKLAGRAANALQAEARAFAASEAALAPAVAEGTSGTKMTVSLSKGETSGKGGSPSAGVAVAKPGTASGTSTPASLKRLRTPRGAGPRETKALPSLDSTGKVHGTLPGADDLGRYSVDELRHLQTELTRSIQTRIKVTKRLGSHKPHGERQAAEQRLLQQIKKHLEQSK